MSQAERKAKIDPTQALSVTRQCKVLSISRSSAYYKPQGSNDEELALMRQLDELHLVYPFYGARRLGIWGQTTFSNERRLRAILGRPEEF